MALTDRTAIAKKKGVASKVKQTKTKVKTRSWRRRTVGKGTLRNALMSGLKAKSGRTDIKYKDPTNAAASTQRSIPIEQRAGYPLKRAKGSPDPKDWITATGCRVEVDFARAAWLPDDWGQAVKPTQMTTLRARRRAGNGGILTTYVAPDGKCFFHKETSEAYAGTKFTKENGFNGQIRLAQLQAQQAVQLARAQIKESSNSFITGHIGTDPDSDLFALLTPKERKCLPSKDQFHFCVVSARRASKLQGITDIMMVETQLRECGVTPTWYVDEASVKEYKALNLKVVVGGKLTQARNKCLKDARRMNKVCVQLSDDISAWEYRDGKQAAVKTDDAMNLAHKKARRLIITPVAAARFICAKMRGADEPKPKLGGVYMIQSCSRTFAGPPFVQHNFILGDFFVVDVGSKVNFDEEMKLKEDYDFTCAHLKTHGSVMRCQRMTLNVKHYANQGGACSNRDSKGEEEKRNIAILMRKYPGCFRLNPKRRNEVIMRWKKDAGTNDDDDEDNVTDEGSAKPASRGRKPGVKLTIKKGAKSASGRASPKAGAKKAVKTGELPPTAVLLGTSKESTSSAIKLRCKQATGRTIEKALTSVKVKGAGGKIRPYSITDLKYDLKTGFLKLGK